MQDNPGRECGGCTVCCTFLGIDAADFAKPPGVTCGHCTQAGCAVHATRPDVCRTFFCGWRLIGLGEDWRPDRSEVLVILQSEAIREDGVKLVLLALDKVFWKPLVDYVSLLIARGEPVHLCVPGEAGRNLGRVRLNDNPLLRQAVARRDFAAITALLSQAVQLCIALPKDKMTFRNAGTSNP